MTSSRDDAACLILTHTGGGNVTERKDHDLKFVGAALRGEGEQGHNSPIQSPRGAAPTTPSLNSWLMVRR
jgi:hypothetical protein